MVSCELVEQPNHEWSFDSPGVYVCGIMEKERRALQIREESGRVRSKIKPAQSSREAKQLRLPLESVECRYYQDCAAPLCPSDVYFGSGTWFPPEPVCRLRSAPEWVRKQRQIARLPRIDPDRYFTFRMLNAIPKVGRGLEGANPDRVTAERIWFTKWVGRRVRKGVAGPDAEIRMHPLV